MARIFVVLIALFACHIYGAGVVWAQPDVPQLTFAQQTAIVVAAKQANPALLDVRFSQQQADVHINVIVGNNLSAQQAQALGLSVLRLTKSMSLDAPVPAGNAANDVGKGGCMITRCNWPSPIAYRG